MKSEYCLMHTDNVENLMLCNLYIIKLVEHSQMLSVYNHPLRNENCMGCYKKKRTKTIHIIIFSQCLCTKLMFFGLTTYHVSSFSKRMVSSEG